MAVLDRLVGMDPIDSEYAAFVELHARSLFGTAYLLCGDSTSAEDLVQDALVATFERWPTIGETANPLGYVRRMLVTASSTAPAVRVAASGSSTLSLTVRHPMTSLARCWPERRCENY